MRRPTSARFRAAPAGRQHTPEHPVPLMKLVEVVQTILTDEKTVLAAYEWVQAIGNSSSRCISSTT